MNIQDRKKSFTAEELRRRYNLDALDKDRKAIQLIRNTINRVEIQFQKFIDVINKILIEYPNQTDDNITVWFFNGIPSSERPEIVSQQDHLGDLYYDRDSGNSYEYKLVNNDYTWVQITDDTITHILAIEASCADTGDNKRVIFLQQPTPLYEIGDVWINNGKYYRCRAKRTEGNYNALDWIIYTDYTDDMVNADTAAELNQLKTTVTEDYVSNATFETTVNSIDSIVSETYTYLTEVANSLGETEEKVDQINNQVITNQAATQYSIDVINEQLTNGVGTLRNSLVTIDINGINVSTNLSKISTIMTNNKFAIKDNSGAYLAYFGYDETEGRSKAEMDNLTVTNYFVAGYHRTEKFDIDGEERTGWFYVGGGY